LKIERKVMESIVIDRQILPELILSYIHSDKIRKTTEQIIGGI
jgi:hypothetical protein